MAGGEKSGQREGRPAEKDSGSRRFLQCSNEYKWNFRKKRRRKSRFLSSSVDNALIDNRIIHIKQAVPEAGKGPRTEKRLVRKRRQNREKATEFDKAAISGQIFGKASGEEPGREGAKSVETPEGTVEVCVKPAVLEGLRKPDRRQEAAKGLTGGRNWHRIQKERKN